MARSSTKYKNALAKVLQHEGGYVNNPNDPGGATNFGISLRFLVDNADIDSDGIIDFDNNNDGIIDAEDIKRLTPEQVGMLYHNKFWNPNKYDRIINDNIATKVFDICVNMGARQANKCLQRALRAVGSPCIDDGVIGPDTLRAVNGASSLELMPAFRSEVAGIYRQIVAKNPKSSVFLTGWLRRAYE